LPVVAGRELGAHATGIDIGDQRKDRVADERPEGHAQTLGVTLERAHLRRLEVEDEIARRPGVSGTRELRQRVILGAGEIATATRRNEFPDPEAVTRRRGRHGLPTEIGEP
jgi:hypothetical protein